LYFAEVREPNTWRCTKRKKPSIFVSDDAKPCCPECKSTCSPEEVWRVQFLAIKPKTETEAFSYPTTFGQYFRSLDWYFFKQIKDFRQKTVAKSDVVSDPEFKIMRGKDISKVVTKRERERLEMKRKIFEVYCQSPEGRKVKAIHCFTQYGHKAPEHIPSLATQKYFDELLKKHNKKKRKIIISSRFCERI